jgi:protein-tyrosine phosphatase
MIELPMTKKVWNHFENLYLHPTEILPGIYLGNAYNASNYKTIERLNIKTIINVSKEIPNFFEKNTTIKYLQIPIKDDSENHITEFIRPTLEFLNLHEPYDENKSILIHCYMGSSRSASIVLLYLIYKYQYSYNAALELLLSKRPIVNINTNFLKDIYDFFNEEPLVI